jgi:hypothetical protein
MRHDTVNLISLVELPGCSIAGTLPFDGALDWRLGILREIEAPCPSRERHRPSGRAAADDLAGAKLTGALNRSPPNGVASDRQPSSLTATEFDLLPNVPQFDRSHNLSDMLA